MSNIREKARNIISDRLNVPIDEVQDEKTFHQLDADSLDAVEVVMELEKEFDIKISDTEMESIDSIGTCIKMIQHKVAEKEKPVSSL